MQKVILVLPSGITKIAVFFEIVQNLSHILFENNIKNEIHFLDPSKEYNFVPQQLYIMYAIEDFANHPQRFICMQFEQLDARINHFPGRENPKEFKKYILNIFKKALYIFDYSYKNTDFLRKNGLNAITVPYGFSPILSVNIQPIPISERNIDILWYGNKCPRRKKLLDRMGKINIVIKDSSLWNNPLKQLGDISYDKTNTVNNTKIVLNIKYDSPSWSIIETPRIIHAISNGCLVISESSYDSQLNAELKENIVLCHHSQLADMCIFYLSNPDILQKKINKTYNWLINNYKYSDKIPWDLLNLLI